MNLSKVFAFRYVFVALFLSPIATWADVLVVDYEKIAEKRLTRTVYEYEFKVTLQNQGDDAVRIVASVTSSSAHTVVVDGESKLAELAAGATAVSDDTITLRHDRLHAFDLGDLVWNVVATARSATPGDYLVTVALPIDLAFDPDRFVTVPFYNGKGWRVNKYGHLAGSGFIEGPVRNFSEMTQHETSYFWDAEAGLVSLLPEDLESGVFNNQRTETLLSIDAESGQSLLNGKNYLPPFYGTPLGASVGGSVHEASVDGFMNRRKWLWNWATERLHSHITLDATEPGYQPGVFHSISPRSENFTGPLFDYFAPIVDAEYQHTLWLDLFAEAWLGPLPVPDETEIVLYWRALVDDPSFGRYPLPLPEGFVGSTGYDINRHGVAVGNVHNFDDPKYAPGAYPAELTPVVWRDTAHVETLPLIEGFREGVALGLNDNGVIVGTNYNFGFIGASEYGYRAFIHQDGNSYRLSDYVIDEEEWVLEFAWSINNSGQIAAYGYKKNDPVRFPQKYVLLLTPQDLTTADVAVDLEARHFYDTSRGFTMHTLLQSIEVSNPSAKDAAWVEVVVSLDRGGFVENSMPENCAVENVRLNEFDIDTTQVWSCRIASLPAGESVQLDFVSESFQLGLGEPTQLLVKVLHSQPDFAMSNNVVRRPIPVEGSPFQ